MTRLVLIRHGQTPSNVLGLLDTGAPGPGLTELGRQQAAGVVDHMAERDVDEIFVSSLIRTHETAAPLAAERGLAPVPLAGIHEVEAGELEMRSDEDSVRRYMRTAFAWGAGDLSVRMPGGADGHEFFARFDADIAHAAEAGEHPVVVSHGAAIRIWVAGRARNIEPAFTAFNHMPNAGIAVLEGSPDDGWRLLEWPGAEVPSGR